MNLNVPHRRLMQDVLEIGNNLPLVITGGYAVQAHQLVDRLSRDIDVATDSDIPMDDIATAVVAGLTARGWDMRIIGWSLLANVTPGMSNSASVSSRHVLRVPNGRTTRRSPNMGFQ